MGQSQLQFEAVVTRRFYQAYPSASKDFLDRLAVQSFIDGIQDVETQHSLAIGQSVKDRRCLCESS